MTHHVRVKEKEYASLSLWFEHLNDELILLSIFNAMGLRSAPSSNFEFRERDAKLLSHAILSLVLLSRSHRFKYELLLFSIAIIIIIPFDLAIIAFLLVIHGSRQGFWIIIGHWVRCDDALRGSIVDTDKIVLIGLRQDIFWLRRLGIDHKLFV